MAKHVKMQLSTEGYPLISEINSIVKWTSKIRAGRTCSRQIASASEKYRWQIA